MKTHMRVPNATLYKQTIVLCVILIVVTASIIDAP